MEIRGARLIVLFPSYLIDCTSDIRLHRNAVANDGIASFLFGRLFLFVFGHLFESFLFSFKEVGLAFQFILLIQIHHGGIGMVVQRLLQGELVCLPLDTAVDVNVLPLTCLGERPLKVATISTLIELAAVMLQARIVASLLYAACVVAIPLGRFFLDGPFAFVVFADVIVRPQGAKHFILAGGIW